MQPIRLEMRADVEGEVKSAGCFGILPPVGLAKHGLSATDCGLDGLRQPMGETETVLVDSEDRADKKEPRQWLGVGRLGNPAIAFAILGGYEPGLLCAVAQPSAQSVDQIVDIAFRKHSTRPVSEGLEQLGARHQSVRLTHEAQQQGALLPGEAHDISIIAPGRQHIGLEGEIVIANQKIPPDRIRVPDQPSVRRAVSVTIGCEAQSAKGFSPLRQKNPKKSTDRPQPNSGARLSC